jgi:hypothetical protein
MQAVGVASIHSGRPAGSFNTLAAAESVLQVLRIRCCRQPAVELLLLLAVDLVVASTPGVAMAGVVAAVVVVVHL